MIGRQLLLRVSVLSQLAESACRVSVPSQRAAVRCRQGAVQAHVHGRCMGLHAGRPQVRVLVRGSPKPPTLIRASLAHALGAARFRMHEALLRPGVRHGCVYLAPAYPWRSAASDRPTSESAIPSGVPRQPPLLGMLVGCGRNSGFRIGSDRNETDAVVPSVHCRDDSIAYRNIIDTRCDGNASSRPHFVSITSGATARRVAAPTMIGSLPFTPCAFRITLRTCLCSKP